LWAAGETEDENVKDGRHKGFVTVTLSKMKSERIVGQGIGIIGFRRGVTEVLLVTLK
jgi:hypothetical protein